MSTNPDEDQTHPSQPDTAFLSKARITDWETEHTFQPTGPGTILLWAELLHPLREHTGPDFEIGSWEGRSALFFLNYLPLSRIVCIDPFEGNVEHQLDPHFQQLVTKTEAQFDSTLPPWRAASRKSKGVRDSSADALVFPDVDSISLISMAVTWPPTSIATRS